MLLPWVVSIPRETRVNSALAGSGDQTARCPTTSPPPTVLDSRNRNERAAQPNWACTRGEQHGKNFDLCVCLFVCLLINYNVAFDRTNIMATINVRQRINVPETMHVQAHTIKILGPTAKGPKAQITHTPNKMTPQEHGNQSLQTGQREAKNGDGNPLAKNVSKTEYENTQ